MKISFDSDTVVDHFGATLDSVGVEIYACDQWTCHSVHLNKDEVEKLIEFLKAAHEVM